MVKHLYKYKKINWMNSALSWLSIILHWLEIFIAIFVIFLVIMGTYSVISIFIQVDLGNTGTEFYHNFEELLSNILLIIIGIELAILLIRRSPESLVEVMFFVVARKMLIKSHGFLDILIGVVSIAGLFAVRKYLEHTVPERQMLRVHIDEEEEHLKKKK